MPIFSCSCFFNELIRDNWELGLHNLPSMVKSFKDVLQGQLFEMVRNMEGGQFTLREYHGIVTASQNQEVITPNLSFYL